MVLSTFFSTCLHVLFEIYRWINTTNRSFAGEGEVLNDPRAQLVPVAYHDSDTKTCKYTYIRKYTGSRYIYIYLSHTL